jgi:hypothetical protein
VTRAALEGVLSSDRVWALLTPAKQAIDADLKVGDMLMDIIRQGARARAMGHRVDDCPYHGESRERRAWIEGYEASSWEFGTSVPHPARRLPGTTSLDDDEGRRGSPPR